MQAQLDFETQPRDSSGVYTIWPGDGRPDDTQHWLRHEQVSVAPDDIRIVRNVTVPTLTVFRPSEDVATGTSVVIVPGGAFHFLAIDHEGYDVARWFSARGVTAFVLKYRLQETPTIDADLPGFLETLGRNLPAVEQTTIDPPQSYPPVQEARRWAEADIDQALDFLRCNAGEFGIAPDRIGMIGFSAGGAGINVVVSREVSRFPAFVVGIYPGWKEPLEVPAGVPPLFLAAGDSDIHVAPISTARLYEAWHKAGGSAELHIFASGPHGFGMTRQDGLTDAWTGLLENWLRSQGFLATERSVDM